MKKIFLSFILILTLSFLVSCSTSKNVDFYQNLESLTVETTSTIENGEHMLSDLGTYYNKFSYNKDEFVSKGGATHTMPSGPIKIKIDSQIIEYKTGFSYDVNNTLVFNIQNSYVTNFSTAYGRQGEGDWMYGSASKTYFEIWIDGVMVHRNQDPIALNGGGFFSIDLNKKVSWIALVSIETGDSYCSHNVWGDPKIVINN